MIYPKKIFRLLLIITTSAFGLISCTPSFKTTAEDCVTFSPVRLAVSDYIVNANSTTNDYKLYLEDTLNNLSDLQSITATANDENPTPEALSENEQAAINFIIETVKEELGYEIENGTVVSAENQLDFIESLIAASDPDEIIETFVDAKQNAAQAIAKNDSVCNYRNDAIEIQREADSGSAGSTTVIESFFAQLDINFNPRSGATSDIIDMNVGITPKIDIREKLLESFDGFNRMNKNTFNALGVSPSLTRVLTLVQNKGSEGLQFNDDFEDINDPEDLNISTLGFTNVNTFCLSEDNKTEVVCPEGTVTRTPEIDACKGGEGSIKNEIGQVKLNTFNILKTVPELSDLQRFKIEVDYDNDEIRLYVSKFQSAFLRPGEGIDIDNYNPEEDVIINDTPCEVRGAREELRILQGKETTNGITVTRIQDPGYDFIDIIDDNGEVTGTQEPTPIYTFKRTVPITRQ